MIEAMKQALEALSWASDQIDPEQNNHCLCPICKCIDALNQAIAEAEKQEPVAWRHKRFFENASGWFYSDWNQDGLNPSDAQLLYTHPPKREWVGLTDEEMQEIALEVPMDAVRITEAKLKKKNGYAKEKNT